MTPTEIQITELLLRRRQIDQTPEGGYTQNQRWLLDAVEALLRRQLELVEELRNQGILR